MLHVSKFLGALEAIGCYGSQQQHSSTASLACRGGHTRHAQTVSCRVWFKLFKESLH